MYEYLILYLSAVRWFFYCIALLRKKRYNMPKKHEVNPTQVYTLFCVFISFIVFFIVVAVCGIFKSFNTSSLFLQPELKYGMVLLLMFGLWLSICCWTSGSFSDLKMPLKCSQVRVYWLHLAHLVNFERDCFLSVKVKLSKPLNSAFISLILTSTGALIEVKKWKLFNLYNVKI